MKQIDISKMTEKEALSHLKTLGFSSEKASEMCKGDAFQEEDEQSNSPKPNSP